jgi:NAD(P)-dependent dehydrogenase (short-subunit alcohol dehydrogenase family)
VRELGGLDILVSNAARQEARESILDISSKHPKKTMPITLTPEQENWIEAHIATGEFAFLEKAAGRVIDERIAELAPISKRSIGAWRRFPKAARHGRRSDRGFASASCRRSTSFTSTSRPTTLSLSCASSTVVGESRAVC